MGRRRRSKPKYLLVTVKAPTFGPGRYACRLHDGTARGKVLALWKRNGKHWGYACEDCFALAAYDYPYKGDGFEYAMRIDVSFLRDLKTKRLKELDLILDSYGIARPA